MTNELNIHVRRENYEKYIKALIEILVFQREIEQIKVNVTKKR